MTGLLFGGERAGLETADIALCQAIVTMPVSQRFRSLNLAQAVAVCAYEWRMACDGGTPATFATDTPRPTMPKPSACMSIWSGSWTPPASSFRRRSGRRWSATSG